MKRESIIKSTFRSLFSSFAVVIGVALSLAVVMLTFTSFSQHGFVSIKTSPLIDIDANGERELLPSSAPAVLKVNIHGVIGTRELNVKQIEAQLADSRSGFLKGDRVKAIFLHIDSPGGSAIDSFNIYRAFLDYKKTYNVPIYAFVDGLCASGSMMIACAADKIYSNPMSVIGSVGVRMGPSFNVAQLMEKLGIKQKTFTRGKDKDMLNPFRTWETGEDQSLEDIISHDYALFVNLVTQARPRLNKEKLIEDYGAQIFDPVKAQTLGYIDNSNSSYRETLADLTKKAGIEEDESYQVVELRIHQPILSGFVEGNSPLISGVLNHKLQLPDTTVLIKPLCLYTPNPKSSLDD